RPDPPAPPGIACARGRCALRGRARGSGAGGPPCSHTSMAGPRAGGGRGAGGGGGGGGAAPGTRGGFAGGMNPHPGIVLLLVIAGFSVAGVVGYRRTTESREQAAKEISALRLRNESLERLGWLRSNPDPDGYRSDVKGFLRWYFEQVSAHQGRFGGNPAFDDYLKDMDAQAKAKAELDIPQLPHGKPRL